MLTALFQEVHPDLGVYQQTGSLPLETNVVEEAVTKATSYARMLTEVRGTKVTFMLETEHGGILVF